MIPRGNKIVLTQEQEVERNSIIQYIRSHGISLVPYSQEVGGFAMEGMALMHGDNILEIDITNEGEVNNQIPEGMFPELQEYILKYIKEVGYVYMNPFFKGLLS